jgi:hypothetical protein
MKPTTEWRENDLTQMIADEAEENINTEFKRAEAVENMNVPAFAERCKTDIGKDVSCFANSAGGRIIYGIEEDERQPHKATALSPIDPNKCSKERLEQVINSRIQPRIQGLLIHPISLRQVQQPGKVVYVVQIPQSFTAHQASDYRYYKRFNFESVAMEDYEVRQAMNRQIKPSYHVLLHANPIGTDKLFLAGTTENTSAMIAHEVSTVLLVPEELSSGRGRGSEIIDEIVYVRVLSDRGLAPQLTPFATTEIIFATAVRIPDPIPSPQFPVLVRVYDQFGQGHEAEFQISLLSSPRGLVVGQRQQGRYDTS